MTARKPKSDQKIPSLDDDALDEALEETFPASDPTPTTPVPDYGIPADEGAAPEPGKGKGKKK